MFAICTPWQDVQHQFEDTVQQAQRQGAQPADTDMVRGALVGDRPVHHIHLQATEAQIVAYQPVQEEEAAPR